MNSVPLPVLFIGHGSPMNAVEDNYASRGWRAAAASIPRPRAILCVSAHWETDTIAVTAMAQPKTIHDFYGFPKAVFDARYPAPGDPQLARRVAALLAPETVALDHDWGLDHGSWSVLLQMFPHADIPVVQMSLPRRPARGHFDIGHKLAALRDEGVLILGSGNIVHNLRLFSARDPRVPEAWLGFNNAVKHRVLLGDHDAVIAYESLTPEAKLSVPTPEHYLPLLYVLGARRPGDAVAFFNDDDPSAIFMTSLRLG